MGEIGRGIPSVKVELTLDDLTFILSALRHLHERQDVGITPDGRKRLTELYEYLVKALNHLS